MEQRRFVSLAEAATLANTSIDTVRRKLRKGEIRKAQTNKRGLFIDLESLREAFDLPSNAGQADDTAERAESAGAALREMIKTLEARLSEMRLEAADAALKHRDEVAGLEARIAVADALATQRQAEVERLHELCRASAMQTPGIRQALRAWIARRLAA